VSKSESAIVDKKTYISSTIYQKDMSEKTKCPYCERVFANPGAVFGHVRGAHKEKYDEYRLAHPSKEKVRARFSEPKPEKKEEVPAPKAAPAPTSAPEKKAESGFSSEKADSFLSKPATIPEKRWGFFSGTRYS
jgi:hypothetical protein